MYAMHNGIFQRAEPVGRKRRRPVALPVARRPQSPPRTAGGNGAIGTRKRSSFASYSSLWYAERIFSAVQTDLPAIMRSPIAVVLLLLASACDAFVVAPARPGP